MLGEDCIYKEADSSMRNKLFIPVLLLAVLLTCASSRLLTAENAAGSVNIPYQKFVLDNGLTLIVHEDHKAPIVAFNIWYHVGSKNEKPGRTGFAHLFEHLMFNGSEHYNDDYFKPMQKIGATDLNGTTNEDRTNYFENVPVSALDSVLWMESDRMGYLQAAIDQAKLDEQRGVVQNEKREYENEPYSVADELIAKAVFPAAHPYSWTIIGSMDDLGAAKLDDVHHWFSSYYGPNNAVIVIAGDITPEQALEKVKRFFGHIPPGPPIARFQSWVAKRSGMQRQTVQDRVPQARIMKIWNVPQTGTVDNNTLLLAARVLGQGKTSRLYKRLIYDDQIATDVQVYLDTREIASLFIIQADAKQDVELAKVERAIDEELNRFLAEGPTQSELQRVRTQYVAAFIRQSERIGGFGGKSDILAQSQVYLGTADGYKNNLKYIAEATPESVKQTAVAWLSDGLYTLEIVPFPKVASSGKDPVDRSKMAEPGAVVKAAFPAFQRATLPNGMKLIVAERHSVPLVQFSLMLDSGYAADQNGIPGTSTLAMNMLDEGTATRNSLQISEELAQLGATLSTQADLDNSYVRLSALKQNLDPSLAIFADVLLNPSFPEADFRRLQALQIAGIAQEKASPFPLALRVLPRLIYGTDHAYSAPFTGSGYEAGVSKLTRQDMVDYHKTWFKPNNATLVIVGDTTLAEIKPRIEKLFNGWAKGTVPKKNIKDVSLPKTTVYLMDRPDAQQSVVIAGQPAPSSSDPDRIQMEIVNFILGGDFVSRINMNIRENKHWSYGSYSGFVGGRGQQPFLAYAPVQGDKTSETMQELQMELDGIVGKKPITQDEFANARKANTLQLSGQWETSTAVRASLEEMVRYNLPDGYWPGYAGEIEALKIEDLGRVATKAIHPQSLVWIVVGDRSKIEPGIRKLNYGDLVIIDGDGNIVK